jgi:PKD repeat protein
MKLFLCTILLGASMNAFAVQTYLTNFKLAYPNSKTSASSCVVCHANTSTFERNPYGQDFENNGHNFKAIEGFDSDVDGFTNIQEITAGTLPGDPSSHPTTNLPPVGDLVPSTLTGKIPLSVNFQAQNVSDPDGTVASVGWTFGDGATATGMTAAHVFTTVGAFTVTMTLTDNLGATTKKTVTITTTNTPPGNLPPVGDLVASSLSGIAPLKVDFQAQNVSDPDGTVTSIGWNFGDGATGMGAAVSHEFMTVGTFTVTMTLTDNLGAMTKKTAIITTTSNSPTNHPPKGDIFTSKLSGNAPLKINFKAIHVSDSDGKVTSIDWNFGDGKTAHGANVWHSFIRAGYFVVTMTITDNGGAKTSTAVKIKVKKHKDDDDNGSFAID